MKQIKGSSLEEEIRLSEFKLFKLLPPEEIELLKQNVHFSFYRKGSIIYREGSRINDVFLIVSGVLKLFKTGVDLKEQIFRLAKREDLIGFRSVISGEAACSTAKSISDIALFRIPSISFKRLLKCYPEFSLSLLNTTCKELNDSNMFLTDLAQKTVRERLAGVLLRLMNDFGLDNSNTLNIALTREEVANIVGTATETVIRLLSEFKNDALIEIQGRRIKLLNVQGLERIGRFEI